MILFFARKRSATCSSDDKLTTGSVGMLVQFGFSAEWEGITSKVAVFRAGSVSVDVLLTDDSCTVPPEVLATPGDTLTIGVYGTDGTGAVVIPTVYAEAGRILRGAEPSGIEPTPQTQPLIDQLLAAAQAARSAADAAEALARSVREDADAGAFDGAPGQPGPKGDDYILTDADKAEIARSTAEIILEPRTASGDPLTVTDGVGGVRASSLVCAVLPSQEGSGDPSPSNERAIRGTDALTVTRLQDDAAWTAQLGRTVYGGRLDLVTGVLTIDRSTAPLSWSLRNAGGEAPWIRLEGAFPSAKADTRQMWRCSRAKTYVSSGTSTPGDHNYTIWQYDETTARIYLPAGSTTEDAAALMSGIRIVHPLAAPVTVSLAPQEIEMLEGANTLSGTGSGLTLTYPALPAGSGGTSDYSGLSNKPQIGGVELSGNKTAAQLGLVAAENGKGLSSNDYTSAEKNKLAGIEAGAQANPDLSGYAKQSWVQQQGYLTFATLPVYAGGVS